MRCCSPQATTVCFLLLIEKMCRSRAVCCVCVVRLVFGRASSPSALTLGEERGAMVIESSGRCGETRGCLDSRHEHHTATIACTHMHLFTAGLVAPFLPMLAFHPIIGHQHLCTDGHTASHGQENQAKEKEEKGGAAAAASSSRSSSDGTGRDGGRRCLRR